MKLKLKTHKLMGRLLFSILFAWFFFDRYTATTGIYITVLEGILEGEIPLYLADIIRYIRATLLIIIQILIFYNCYVFALLIVEVKADINIK